MLALAFLRLPIPPTDRPPAFAALHDWLDSWSGIGLIEHGMAQQGFDLSLTRYANEAWRATFFNSGKEHSVVAGSAWEPTAWRAVQGAAWEALRKLTTPTSPAAALKSAARPAALVLDAHYL